MENLKIRCRSCGKELEGHLTKTVSCGCPNMATIRGDKISALDLSDVVMLNSIYKKTSSDVLSSEDLAYQEARRARKVRRLVFEIR